MNGNRAVRPTLVVFCRRPAEGIGKQRIAAEVGAVVALELAARLLDAALEDALAWPGPVALAPACTDDAPWASGLLARPANVVPQGEGNLGERLNAVDRELRRAGHEHIIYIGTDAPLLDYAYYARARLALRHADVVLGPAEDGGVTLMGARRAWPDMADLPWSTTRLGDALDRRCRAHGLTVHSLDPQYDIDAAGQLARLHAELGPDLRPARRALRGWLETRGFAQIHQTVMIAGRHE
jgi:hypothetical protein